MFLITCIQKAYLLLIVLQYSDDWWEVLEPWKQIRALWQLCRDSLVSVWALTPPHPLHYIPLNRRNWCYLVCSKACQHIFRQHCFCPYCHVWIMLCLFTYCHGIHKIFLFAIILCERRLSCVWVGVWSQRNIPSWCVCNTNHHLSFSVKGLEVGGYLTRDPQHSLSSLLQTLLPARCCVA